MKEEPYDFTDAELDKIMREAARSATECSERVNEQIKRKFDEIFGEKDAENNERDTMAGIDGGGDTKRA